MDAAPRPDDVPAVKTLGRAFDVVNLFLGGRSSMTLTEISQTLGWNKATAFRLCKGLEQIGLLQREGQGAFSLGPVALDLGTAYLAANPTRSRAVHVAEALSRRSGATVLIGSLVREEVLVVLTAEGDTAIKAAARLGDHMPVHATAAGKSIAATLSDEELDRLLRGYRFTTYTPRTISSATRFRAELEKVRKEGYSLTLNEFQDGVFSVGVSLDRGLFARPSALVAVLPAVLAPADGHEALVHDLLAARATLDPFREVRLS